MSNALPKLNMGIYTAIKTIPIITPIKIIRAGSIIEVKRSTIASTIL